jgi:hypothetical protein
VEVNGILEVVEVAEAATHRGCVTMEELLKENKETKVDLSGLKVWPD